MGSTNQSMVMYFIIKGISDVPELQALIFLLVLLMYLLTLGGNMAILLLVCLDPRLHTPMYFFLGNLSIMDMFSTTTTLHMLFSSFIFGDNTISFLGCMAQFYIFASLTGGELLILTAMSYDRYVAICKPLHYGMVMNFRACILLAIACWCWCFIETIPLVLILSGFNCYESTEINHFVCDIRALLNLICNDTSALDIALFLVSTFLATFPSLLTFIPYVFIILTILKIDTSTGRRKAFYTCSSHLTVVILLYTTLVLQYLRPTSTDNLDSNKLLSLFNTAAVPMLNPLIYSLRNKDVRAAVRSLLRRSCSVFQP